MIQCFINGTEVFRLTSHQTILGCNVDVENSQLINERSPATTTMTRESGNKNRFHSMFLDFFYLYHVSSCGDDFNVWCVLGYQSSSSSHTRIHSKTGWNEVQIFWKCSISIADHRRMSVWNQYSLQLFRNWVWESERRRRRSRCRGWSGVWVSLYLWNIFASVAHICIFFSAVPYSRQRSFTISFSISYSFTLGGERTDLHSRPIQNVLNMKTNGYSWVLYIIDIIWWLFQIVVTDSPTRTDGHTATKHTISVYWCTRYFLSISVSTNLFADFIHIEADVNLYITIQHRKRSDHQHPVVEHK